MLLAIVALLLFFIPAAAGGQEELQRLKTKTDAYLSKVERQPDWLLSRLQMYWNSHATEVYVNGESFDHPGGHRAPAATVKFNGTRNTFSYYNRPPLEEVIPYDDDPDGCVTYINKSTGQMEKAHPSKTGCNINALNVGILNIARDASAIYKMTGDKRYADMAAKVFDTYLKGIYYRNMPIDLSNGHIQTLVGMATFEVIHEDAITPLTEIYRNLGGYLENDRQLYEATLKKWAEVIIANGVPHNNWNLFQAVFIARIAIVLQDDSRYDDKKGRQYYLDYIINRSSIRQWSLRQLCSFGFDKDTHIWYESPGYSLTVLRDFAEFIDMLDKEAGIDLIKEIPSLVDAEMAMTQYMTPNRMFCGFGDSHPAYMNTQGIDALIAYARRKGDAELAGRFEDLKRVVAPDAPAADLQRYVSASFYAPNVSWLIQRTGMDSRHDLSVSLNGSLGNHQHANGISMELYGKGYMLGPDAGIGRNLYGGEDYKEYYSQFPAHNTVCVDGVSSYPVMMSQHAFKLKSRYPETNQTGLFPPVTYSEVSFVEPESQSDQQRLNGIVKVGRHGGYYVDVFRSRKKHGGDKMHDYFYHNLGQSMDIRTADGKSLGLQPTQEPAFAGGFLYAYSYIYNKEDADMDGDIKTTFTTHCKDGRTIDMTMWMRGAANRKIVKALSPVNLQYERMPNQPYDIEQQPVLTFIARQAGEAWNHPFVAIYEPCDNEEPSEIESVGYFSPSPSNPSAVGIIVRLKSGRTDYIFSSDRPDVEMSYGGMRVRGSYAVISDGFAFLGNGTLLKSAAFHIRSKQPKSEYKTK